ncbi:MAG: hypothetical protein K2I81_01385, partial [Alphaproteobacteria bacterium]|nr:hypothetical protein [Alphaproteobacteria bacterium]
IHNSAYIKLKWMMRFIVMLAIVLFLLTESVPVFLGAIAAMFAMFAMSVWHAASVPENLRVRFRATVLFAFGMVTTLPVISALGVMLWACAGASKSSLWAESKFLL